MKNTTKGLYKQLNLSERVNIYSLREQGKSLRDIAREIDRDVGTISRELRRNKSRADFDYLPVKAHENAIKRLIRQRTKAPLKNPETYVYVREKLREEKWSPEEIAGRIRIDKPHLSICFETIYSYIYVRGKRHKLWKHLTKSHKKRRVKTGRKVQSERGRVTIPDAVSVLARPQKVQKRKTEGHLETDLMEGIKSETDVVSVEVFRKTRYTQLSKMKNKKAKTKKNILTKKLKMIQSLSRAQKPIVKSVTSDNGKENTDHKGISKKLKIPFYVCQPYHSWEKGTVENTIGRMRRFIPKGTPLSKYSDYQIQWLENKLNNTPRKCLNFLTPNEAFEKEVNSYKFRRFRREKEGRCCTST